MGVFALLAHQQGKDLPTPRTDIVGYKGGYFEKLSINSEHYVPFATPKDIALTLLGPIPLAPM